MKHWPTIPLPEVAFFQEGPGIRKWQFRSAGIKLINVGNIVQGKLDLSRTDRHLDKEEVEKTYSHFLLNAGDLVMATSGATWGKVAFVEPHHLPLCLNTSIVRFRPLTAKTLDPKYLRAFFETPGFRRQIDQIITGSAQPNFGSSHLKQIRLPLPPLAEQERIVKLLDEADELQKLRVQADHRSAALIPALFHEMFGDPSSNPKGWRKENLGTLCDLVNGAPFKPSDWDGSGLPIVRIQNLNDPTKPFNYTSKILADKFRVHHGDTLLSWSGTPGTSFGCFNWKGPEGWLNQHIFNVKLKAEFDSEFFIQSVNVRLGELIAKAHGGVGLQHITKGTLSAVEMLAPPLALQKKFAHYVTEIRELENAQATSRTRLDALFQSVSHRSFTNEL